MTQSWFSTRCWLALCVAASFTGAASRLDAGTLPLAGGTVDADTPATYRLPQVSPPDVTASEPRLAQRMDPIFVPFTPADTLPDEYCLEERGPEPERDPMLAPSWPRDADVFPYTPTTAGLTGQLLPAVQRGYGLAQRGALYAARTEFVQVLRRVAQARDAADGTDEHSQALAAGLRALDEADDFVPHGIQLEAELDVRSVASAHRTPMLRDHQGNALPHQAMALYHGYAQEQLAKAAAGEQAGSMALYGLGKISVRLAERRDHDVRYVRTAMTMYSAALSVCPDNHLAANELGVLLCRTGRPADAARLFERTIDFAPNATAYHNLAVAQQMLGLHGQAGANEQESQRLAAWERASGAVSRKAGVQWVSPADMARVAHPAPGTDTTYHDGLSARTASNPTAAESTSKSAWQRTVELTKSLPRPGGGGPDNELGPRPATHVAQPYQTQWR